jgi:hypothetical protein
MKLRVLFSLAVIVTATGDLYAQYSEDALRFSRSQWGSTARFKAIGAQTGVGGDLSSVGGNPAGIGLFTRSELSITPEFNGHNNSSNYLGQKTTSRGDKLGLANAAVVFHSRLGKPKGASLDQGWLSFNFGLAYNQTQGFENSIGYTGKNPKNSIADYFAESATTIYGAPNTLQSGSLERMAYDNYLIGYDSRGRYYFPETDVNNIQTKNDLRFGRQSEVNFSFGANYSNQFYVGASIGIANINFNTSDLYKEKGFNVTENNDYELSYRQSQLTRGSGFNAKIGALYRPIPNVRIGATIESPTWYTIDDSYSEGLDTKYGKSRIDSQFVNDDEIYDFTYNLRTPLKISTGISYFFNDKGFISADIDYIDYSTINFAQANTDDIQVISDNNKAVMSKFTDAINFRIGAEYKIDKLMLRAGYGSQGDPYISTDNKNFSISTFSGGLGYRINNYYIDMTYQKVVSDSERWPYSLNDVPTSIANIRNNRSNIFLTIGTRF